MEWTRRSFDAVGLTQYPPRKHLAALQSRYGGSVVLCLDVSGSMGGSRLEQAKAGCARFLAEAVSARYEVAGLLWHHGLNGYTDLSKTAEAAERLFARATASGGNDILPTLQKCEQMLADRIGDRVVAIFGDGDLGDVHAARVRAARLAEKGIRVLTCGLGDASARDLDVISSEDAAAPRAATSATIADAIADMASALQRR